MFLVLAHIGKAQEVRIRLENCTLQKETLNEIQNSFNYQLQFYARIFKDQTKTGFRAKIFGTEKEFLKYSKEKTNFNPVRNHSIAFYNFRLREMILHKEVEDLPKTFAHEMNHAMLHYYCESASTWLDEGLAELFEDIVFIDTTYYFDSTQLKKIQKAKVFLLEGASITEPFFTKNFYDTYSSTKNYTLSWALVFYLYKTNWKILSRIIRGNCSEDYDNFFF
jgi:hypothetical protein